eukprot:gene7118-7922_t
MIVLPWKWTILVAITSVIVYLTITQVKISDYVLTDGVDIIDNDNDDSIHQYTGESEFSNQTEQVDNLEVQYDYDFKVDRIVRGLENATDHALKHELPIILWWTPFTGDEGTVRKCWEGSCYFTQDRKFFHDNLAEVFVFYGTGLDDNDLPLPRRDSHEWAILHEESPKNNLLFHHKDFISLFNHTCTFRQQSDYPITTQYLASLENLQKHPVMNFTAKDKQDIASTIYLQSGCNPPSDRDAYVNELMKYLQVDSYGACLHNKELPSHLKSPLTMHDDALRDFVGQYKFSLTFENGICDDYITEKLWRPLMAGTIPIYKGAPNVLEWLPDNQSVILVDDFQSPKILADFLNNLASNEVEYNKYLSFKKKGITNRKLIEHMERRPWGVNDFNKMSFITGFECFICDQIHKNRKLIKNGKSPMVFVSNNTHYGCPKPTTYPYQTPAGFEQWERQTWADEYDEMGFKAGELYKKIFKGRS